jgi:hypothetical protein
MPIAPSDLSQVAATRKETRFLLYGGRGSKLGSSPRSNPGKYGHPKKETTFLDEMVKATRINKPTNIGRTGQSQTRTMSTGSPISFWLVRFPVDSKQFRPANVTTPID